MRLQLLALTLAALPVAACSPELQPVTINFHALVGSRDFACGQSYAGLGSAATMVQPADFRLYIHNVRLVDQTGAERPLTLDQDQLWQYEDVALLDFENKVAPCDGTAAINTTVRGQAAGSGGYTGVRFAVGIPPELNHGNQATAPSPLNFSGLFWTWQTATSSSAPRAKRSAAAAPSWCTWGAPAVSKTPRVRLRARTSTRQTFSSRASIRRASGWELIWRRSWPDLTWLPIWRACPSREPVTAVRRFSTWDCSLAARRPARRLCSGSSKI